jgi:hypothetical protein
MVDIIKRENVTAMTFVTSHLQVLSEHPDFEESFKSVHTFAMMGEPLSLSLYLPVSFILLQNLFESK